MHNISQTYVFTAHISLSLLVIHRTQFGKLYTVHIPLLCSGGWEGKKHSIYCRSVCARSCVCLFQALPLVSTVFQQLCKAGIINGTPQMWDDIICNHSNIQTLETSKQQNCPKRIFLWLSILKNQPIVLNEEQSAVVCGAWQWCALPAGPWETGQWGHGSLGHEIRAGWGRGYPWMYHKWLSQKTLCVMKFSEIHGTKEMYN